MGLDAEIILETGNVETIITINHKIRDVHQLVYTDKIYNDQFQLNGDYAQFRTVWRYWGPGYER
jgi:hypothetical protein